MHAGRVGFFGILIFLILVSAATTASLSAAQKVAICGKRTTCAVTKFHDAGKDASGGAPSVVEIHFGIRDKPADAWDAGCQIGPDSDKTDGVVEYWFVSGPQAVKLLALCKDGYGAEDVGEDKVTFANNRMIHNQTGGSNWRWENTAVFSPSPFNEMRETSCSYFDGSNDNGAVTHTDLQNFRAVVVAKKPGSNWSDDDSGCPQKRTPSGTSAHGVKAGGYQRLRRNQEQV